MHLPTNGKGWRLVLLSVAALMLLGPSAVSAAIKLHSPQTLTSPSTQTDGNFGSSVAVAKGVRVVGAPGESGGGFDGAGHVYIFRSGRAYTLTSPTPQTNGGFGSSVAVSDGRVVVGAPKEQSGGTLSAGNAYVYSEKTGLLLFSLTTPNPQEFGRFGAAVAVGGGLVLVAAPDEWPGGVKAAGDIYVFSAKTGAYLYSISSPNAQASGNFGCSLDLAGGTLAVGAFDEDSGATVYAGNAYVYSISSGGSSLTYSLTSPSPEQNGRFGNSVGVGDGYVIVGAPQEDGDGGPGSYSGSVYAFSLSTGLLVYAFNDPDLEVGALFGWSVAIGGGLFVAGAPVGESGSGVVYGFTTAGTLVQTLKSPNPVANGEFGYAEAVGARQLLVGAYGETVLGVTGAGDAYKY